MEYVTLSNTDLHVSSICLGTSKYGSSLPGPQAKEQLSQFVEGGGNFIDTARVYGDWVPGCSGLSEKVIGEWIKETNGRNRLIICTKGGHPRLDSMQIPRLSPQELEEDINLSLGALKTDYLDLYLLHRDDPSLPVQGVIDLLDRMVEQGKIRYYGCSNWTLPRIRAAQAYAQSKGSPGFVCNQVMWSLAEVNYSRLPDKTMVPMDRALYDYHCESGMNVMAYKSLASGYFTRQYQARPLDQGLLDRFDNPANDRIFHLLRQIADRGEYSIVELLFGYIRTQPFVSIPLTSCRTEQQLHDSLGCRTAVDPALLKTLADMKNFIC